MLEELGRLGNRATVMKAQICKQSVTYLGYKLKEGVRCLTEAMKETILRIHVPTSPREVREFSGYCTLWIPSSAALARPLYEAAKEQKDWEWLEKHQQAFEKLRAALLKAPALTLPNPLKPFSLFMDERKGIAKGVLTQQLGPWKQPVAYLSKKLDHVAAGWPPCLRVIVAIALMVRDAPSART